MKRRLAIRLFLGILLAVAGLPGVVPAQDAATTKPARYSTPQSLLELIKARDSGVIDTNVFDMQLKQRGVGFKWGAETIWSLMSNGMSHAQIEEIEAAWQQAQGPTNSAPAPSAKEVVAASATLGTTNKLSDLLGNQFSLGNNITSNGNSLVTVGSGLGTLTNGNSTIVQSNLVAYGNKLVDLGTNLVRKPPQIPYLVFLSSGATFQNPYVVNVSKDKTTATLDNAGNSTAGFLEFTYLNRYVLRPAAEKETTWNITQGLWLPNGLMRLPDVEFHAGFNFANGMGSASNTSYSAAAIAGGGDFYSDASFGLPLYRYNAEQGLQRHQVSLEASGGVTTEKSFEAVHPQAFVGIGYEASFKALGLQASTNACGYFMGRVGAGWVDSPRILSTTSSNTQVVVSGGLPKFDFDAAPVASVGASLLYPLTENVYLAVNGSVYLKDNPSPWNVSVGASIPFASISKMFGGMINGQ